MTQSNLNQSFPEHAHAKPSRELSYEKEKRSREGGRSVQRSSR